MNLESLTYRHVRVFLALYKSRSASRVAEELKMTNSAITRTIACLREIFSDQLFVRTNKGFEVTAKATEIAPFISHLTEQYRKLDKEFAGFQPDQSESYFEILLYDEFCFAVQKVICEEILPVAPHMHFNVRILNYDCGSDIASGKVDFAVVYEGFDDKRLNYECFAHTHDIYLLSRKGHPLEGRTDLTVEDLTRYRVLEIDNYDDLACPLLVEVCRQYGGQMGIDEYTESVSAAFQTLAETDSVTVVCNQFTLNFADSVENLSYVRLPAAIQGCIKAMRNQVRPIGNYVVYGNANQSQVFRFVKDKLVGGLGQAWQAAEKMRR